MDIIMSLVIYDETEYFKKSDSPLFNYPFVPRKTKINRFSIDFEEFYNDDEDSYIVETSEIQFQKTVTCLEEKYYMQLNFVSDLKELIKKWLGINGL